MTQTEKHLAQFCDGDGKPFIMPYSSSKELKVYLEMALKMVQGESRDPHEPHDCFRRSFCKCFACMRSLEGNLPSLCFRLSVMCHVLMHECFDRMYTHCLALLADVLPPQNVHAARVSISTEA
jgi:hypothetical protein